MRNIILFIITFVWPLAAFELGERTQLSCTASEPPALRHLTTEDGLSSNSVKSIFKDSHGLMYFGTAVGVDRYDGERIVNIRFPVDETREQCWVSDIVEVDDGVLLVSNNAGLWQLDCRSLKLQRIYAEQIEGEVTDMWMDKSTNGKKVYVNTLDATFCLDDYGSRNDGLRRLAERQIPSAYQRSSGSFSYLRDDCGVEWRGMLFVGLEYAPYKRQTFTTYASDDPLAGTRMAGSYRVRTDREGLFLTDTVTKASVRIAGSEALAGSNVYDVCEDGKGHYWVSCQRGLAQLDMKHRSMRLFTTRNSQLPDDEVFCANFDSGGRGWISTRGGLCNYDPATDRINAQHIPRQLAALEMLRSVTWIDDTTLCFLPQHGFPMLTDARVTTFQTQEFDINESSPSIAFFTRWRGHSIFTTERGFYVFTPSGECRTFGHLDGLDDIRVVARVARVDADGRFLLGTRGGMVAAMMDSLISPQRLSSPSSSIRSKATTGSRKRRLHVPSTTAAFARPCIHPT